jgi:hypothetical protein
MEEIGEVLRHRDPSTTEIYAKVDFDGALTGSPLANGRCTVNREQALNDYLSIRRSLGFRLQQQASSLRNFVAFLRAEGASSITTKLALRWATQPAKAHPAAWAWRLGRVRRFAIWHSATEPRTEIPPTGLLPHRRQRKSPHIYSDDEIERLLRRTQQLPSRKGLRSRTFTTLFGLLVATGMRVSEALNSDYADCGRHASRSQPQSPLSIRHNQEVGMFLVELNRYAVWVVLQSSCPDRLSSRLFQFPLLCETMAWLFAAYSISQRRFP